MKKSNYYNPDGIVEKNKQQKIVIRFKTAEDLKLFSEKTGIQFNLNSKRIKFPQSSAFDDFFG